MVVTAGGCADLAGIPDRFYGGGGGAADGAPSGDAQPPGDGQATPDGGFDEDGGGDPSGPFFPPDAGCPACIDSGLCMLACNQNHPSSIAVDATHVYWTNAGDSVTSFVGGSVMRVDKSGSNLTVLTGPVMTRPTSAVASAGCVYWYETSPGIIRKSCSGALSTVISSVGQAISSISVAGSTLLWSTGSGSGDTISKCTLPGCSPTSFVMVNLFRPYAATVDPAGSNVYWLESSSGFGNVLRCPVTGCTTPLTVGVTAAPPLSLAVNASEDTFFTSGTVGQSDGQISDVLFVVGTQTVEARNRPTPLGIASDNGVIYWAEQGSGPDGKVVGCTAQFGALCDPIRVLAARLSYPAAVAIDSTRVYWINAGAPNTPSSGSLMSALR